MHAARLDVRRFCSSKFLLFVWRLSKAPWLPYPWQPYPAISWCISLCFESILHTVSKNAYKTYNNIFISCFWKFQTSSKLASCHQPVTVTANELTLHLACEEHELQTFPEIATFLRPSVDGSFLEGNSSIITTLFASCLSLVGLWCQITVITEY